MGKSKNLCVLAAPCKGEHLPGSLLLFPAQVWADQGEFPPSHSMGAVTAFASWLFHRNQENPLHKQYPTVVEGNRGCSALSLPMLAVDRPSGIRAGLQRVLCGGWYVQVRAYVCVCRYGCMCFWFCVCTHARFVGKISTALNSWGKIYCQF